MAKATSKFSAADLDAADLQMIQNEIVKRLSLKVGGTNLSPHDSHGSSHSKNSVTLGSKKLNEVAKGKISAPKKVADKTTPIK